MVEQVDGARCWRDASKIVATVIMLALTGPYDGVGQVSGWSPPQVVEPGVVSTGNVWRGALSPDGSELYFFRRMTPNAEDYRIFFSRWEGERWGNPRQVGFSGEASDLYPAISPDGSVMVLTSYRDEPGIPPNAHLFKSERSGDVWTTPRYVPELNDPGQYHAQPYFTQDGTLYFRRVGDGGPRVFRAEKSGTGFEDPEEVDFRRPFGAPELDIRGVFLSPAECLAALTVQASRGNTDLYWSERRGEVWSAPVPLGSEFNTEEMELFPFFSPDGSELYFVRGFAEMYVSRISGAGSPEDCR